MITSTHIWAFILAAGLSALLTVLVRKYVLATNIGLSLPRERDIHRQAIPRLGGVAITLSFLLVVIGFHSYSPDLLSFIPEYINGVDRNLIGIVLGVLLLLGVGIVDDVYGIKPFVKLFFHFLAGIILAWSMVLVPHVTNPFGGLIQLGDLTYPFVVLWVVIMINVINFHDGLDGLVSGVSLIASLILYFLAIKPEVNQMSMALLAIILAGALIGFLPFNFYPAKIFLGDSGSQVIGFLLAVFSIISGGKLATAFLVLGVPILDIIWVVARRTWQKQPFYKADKFHIHHRLLKAGLNQKQAVLLLYTVSAAFGIIALQTQSYGKLIAVLILVGMMIVGGGLLVLIANRKLMKQ